MRLPYGGGYAGRDPAKLQHVRITHTLDKLDRRESIPSICRVGRSPKRAFKLFRLAFPKWGLVSDRNITQTQP